MPARPEVVDTDGDVRTSLSFNFATGEIVLRFGLHVVLSNTTRLGAQQPPTNAVSESSQPPHDLIPWHVAHARQA